MRAVLRGQLCDCGLLQGDGGLVPTCRPSQPLAASLPLRHTRTHTIAAPRGLSPPPDGGAILLEDGASLSLTNCALERNWARNGGAVEVAVRSGHCRGG